MPSATSLSRLSRIGHVRHYSRRNYSRSSPSRRSSPGRRSSLRRHSRLAGRETGVHPLLVPPLYDALTLLNTDEEHLGHVLSRINLSNMRNGRNEELLEILASQPDDQVTKAQLQNLNLSRPQISRVMQAVSHIRSGISPPSSPSSPSSIHTRIL